jgi:hypothetical protein
MADAIARYYDDSKNPDGGGFPGVPLRDLTESEFEALPEWLQQSVDASPLYRKTKPRPEASHRTTDADAAPEDAPKARRGAVADDTKEG